MHDAGSFDRSCFNSSSPSPVNPHASPTSTKREWPAGHRQAATSNQQLTTGYRLVYFNCLAFIFFFFLLGISTRTVVWFIKSHTETSPLNMIYWRSFAGFVLFGRGCLYGRLDVCALFLPLMIPLFWKGKTASWTGHSSTTYHLIYTILDFPLECLSESYGN